MPLTSENDDPGVRVVHEETIPEFGVKPPGTSAASGFRVAVIRVIGGVAEEEAAIARFRRARESRS